MSNPFRDYKNNFNNNLPTGVTYKSTISRYFYGNHREISPWKIKSYKYYIEKFEEVDGFLTLEDSSFLLLEDGFKIEL